MLFLSDSPYLKLLSTYFPPLLRHLSCSPSSLNEASSDHKQPAAPRLVMHIITTFVELSNLFSHHSITHEIFTVYFTYLTMNISRFHISCIQKTDNRPYFTVGRKLDHLEHFKRKEQYVNTTCFSRIGVCGLPVNEGRQRACAKSRPQRCGGNTRKRYLLSVYASYIPICKRKE